MAHRVFVAIDLPHGLKEKVSDAISQWRWLSIRWLTPEQWHITVVPPVNLTDEELRDLPKRLARVSCGESFSIQFSRVLLAPQGSPARMIWLEGEAPPELPVLKRKLGRIFPVRGAGGIRAFHPLKLHVTLARFKAGELADLEAKTRVLGEVKFRFTARDIVLMESHFTSSGAEYQVRTRIPLK